MPRLLAVYAFGSRIHSTFVAGSNLDLDLAVLVEGHADPVALWDTAGRLADVAGCTVDLLDFRAASTVLQQQILTAASAGGRATGKRRCTKRSCSRLSRSILGISMPQASRAG